MSVRVQLSSVRPAPGGGIQYMTRTLTVGDVEYEMPLAVQYIDDETGIAPQMHPSEDGRTLVTHLDRWDVMHFASNRKLPLLLVDMASAARVAREFAADSGISWHSDPADIDAWALAWLERERARQVGGDR